MQKYFINSKVVVLLLALFGNSFLMHAQTITDTVFVKHPGVAFHKYDSLAETLYVFNTEFNTSTKQWTIVLDIYGEGENINLYSEEWFKRYKGVFKYKNNPLLYLKEDSYRKKISQGKWTKGDIVKNGYWIQYAKSEGGKLCEGFVINGMKENNWIEYENDKKIREGNYTHNIKEGIWHERRQQVGWENVEMTGQYKNGLKQGEWVENCNSEWIDYSTKGKQWISAQKTYVNDTLEGLYTRWERRWDKVYWNGWRYGYEKFIVEKGIYKNGLRDGEWVLFDQEHIVEHCFWKNGMPEKTIVYTRDFERLNEKKWIAYEVNIIQWSFQDDIRTGYWIYQTVKPIYEYSNVYRWEGQYGISFGTGHEYIQSK